MKSLISPITLKGKGVSREITCPVLQSPLSGVTDITFRRLVRKWAPDALLFTEMVNATSLGMGHGVCKIEELSNEKGPIAVQLFDHRPEAMSEAAKIAEGYGAFLIDINMGCPVKKIARKGGGSALLNNIQLAEEIVRKVSSSVNIPVTVKTRLGWDEESANPLEFSLRLQEAGATLLTLHGRTRKQGFSGKANWHKIKEVKEALNIPVIANGDINNIDNALNCLKTTGADGLMIGRGCMGAPWLLGQIHAVLQGSSLIAEPKAKEKISIALEQLKELVNRKGDHGLLIARKHINWTCKGFPEAIDLRHKVIQAKTPGEAIKILENELLEKL